MGEQTVTKHARAHGSLLAPAEKRALIWMAERLPGTYLATTRGRLPHRAAESRSDRAQNPAGRRHGLSALQAVGRCRGHALPSVRRWRHRHHRRHGSRGRPQHARPLSRGAATPMTNRTAAHSTARRWVALLRHRRTTCFGPSHGHSPYSDEPHKVESPCDEQDDLARGARLRVSQRLNRHQRQMQ